MNVLVVEPGMAPYEKEINGLEEMQAVVGGLLTASYPFQEPVGIISNDESILLGMEFNRSIEGGYGGIFGTFFTEQRIAVRPGMSEVQTIKTLVHEIAHAKLHDPAQITPEEQKQRREKEMEAESVAYVVCQHFGIETSDYSFGYVAGWSKGRELAELKASLDRIHSTAGEIIHAIQPPQPTLQQERAYKSTHQRKHKQK